jgi:hypothetical protein
MKPKHLSNISQIAYFKNNKMRLNFTTILEAYLVTSIALNKKEKIILQTKIHTLLKYFPTTGNFENSFCSTIVRNQQ